MILSIREYAKKHKTYIAAVQRAIASGRITRNADGKIDTDTCDVQWTSWGRIQPGAPLLENVEALPMIEEQSAVPVVLEHRQPIETPARTTPTVVERISEQEARRRKEVALAELRQMEAAEKAGRVIDAQDVRERWTGVATRVRDALLAVPDRAAPGIAGLTGADAGKIRAALQSEIESILRQLHDDLQSTN